MHPYLLMLYALPSAALAALSVALALAMSLLGPWAATRLLKVAPNEERSAAAIDAFKLIGPLTAIFTAFLLLQAVNRLNEARQLVETQAMNILQLDRSLAQLDTAAARDAHRAARDYATALVESGWPAMRAMRASPEVEAALNALSNAVDAAAKSAPDNPRFLQSISSDLGSIGDAQAQIQAAAQGGLPMVFWSVQAILLLAMAAQLAMVGANWAKIAPLSGYCAALGLLIGLLFALDHPFLGDESAEPAPIERAIAQLDLYAQFSPPQSGETRR